MHVIALLGSTLDQRRASTTASFSPEGPTPPLLLHSGKTHRRDQCSASFGICTPPQAAHQGVVHRLDETVDGHGFRAVAVERAALVEGFRAERDVDALHQFVYSYVTIPIAIALTRAAADVAGALAVAGAGGPPLLSPHTPLLHMPLPHSLPVLQLWPLASAYVPDPLQAIVPLQLFVVCRPAITSPQVPSETNDRIAFVHERRHRPTVAANPEEAVRQPALERGPANFLTRTEITRTLDS